MFLLVLTLNLISEIRLVTKLSLSQVIKLLLGNVILLMCTIDQRLGVHYIGQLFEKPINPLPSFNVFPLILLMWWLIYVPTYTFSVAALLW